MAPKELTSKQYKTITSGFRDLRIDLNRFYRGVPQTLEFPKDFYAIQEWTEFEREVRDVNKEICKVEIIKLYESPPGREVYQVANKAGVVARFAQNVCHVMGEIFESMELGIMFADFDFAMAMNPDLADKLPWDGLWNVIHPDIVMIDEKSGNLVALGMVEEPWSSRPSQKEQLEASIANKFGPLVCQMENLGCQYGFYTTYNETWFLYREDEYRFYKSNLYRSKEGSGTTKPSVREGFLFLAAQAKAKQAEKSDAASVEDVNPPKCEWPNVQAKDEDWDWYAASEDQTRSQRKQVSYVNDWYCPEEPKKPEEENHGWWSNAEEDNTTDKRKASSSAPAYGSERPFVDHASWGPTPRGSADDRWDLTEWKEQDPAEVADEEEEDNYVVENTEENSEFSGDAWARETQTTSVAW